MNKKKLKLTKLTVANLNRVKGGILECGCDVTTGDASFNYAVNHTYDTRNKKECVCG